MLSSIDRQPLLAGEGAAGVALGGPSHDGGVDGERLRGAAGPEPVDGRPRLSTPNPSLKWQAGGRAVVRREARATYRLAANDSGTPASSSEDWGGMPSWRGRSPRGEVRPVTNATAAGQYDAPVQRRREAPSAACCCWTACAHSSLK
jgi:hypothetical protein